MAELFKDEPEPYRYWYIFNFLCLGTSHHFRIFIVVHIREVNPIEGELDIDHVRDDILMSACLSSHIILSVLLSALSSHSLRLFALLGCIHYLSKFISESPKIGTLVIATLRAYILNKRCGETVGIASRRELRPPTAL